MSEQEIPGTGEEDYKNHLEEVEDWPSFKITNDPISGRIPVTKIESWKILPDLLEDPFFKRKEHDFIFRGQRKYSWYLTPTLARVDGGGVVREEIAVQLLKDFKLKIRGRIHDYSILEDDHEIWSIGQHHGLKTPLLDWTKSPYVALFFAFNDIDDEEDINTEWDVKSNKYRCLYVLDKRFVEEEEEMSSVSIFEPRMDDHGRLVSQDGLFTITDYETTIEGEVLEYVTNQESFESLSDEDQAEEIAQYICKIYIPNRERKECLKFLRKMNVHHASLFPDLIGASQHSNHLIEEFAVKKLQDEEIHKFVESIGIGKKEQDEEPGSDNKKEEVVSPKDSKDKKGIKDSSDDDVEKKITLAVKNIIDSEDIDEELSEKIANELFENIQPKLKTDWFKREPLLAEIRNTIRSTFKRYDTYISPGDSRLKDIVELLKSNDELRK